MYPFDDLQGITVQEGEFVTTHAEAPGAPVYEPLSKLLARVRSNLEMDVVFVSQFVGGERVVRYVADSGQDPSSIAVGHADPLEESYCYNIVQGRLPAVIPDTSSEPFAVGLEITKAKQIGSYVCAPIIGGDGGVYGTLCCFSHEPNPARCSESQVVLQSIASLISNAIA